MVLSVSVQEVAVVSRRSTRVSPVADTLGFLYPFQKAGNINLPVIFKAFDISLVQQEQLFIMLDEHLLSFITRMSPHESTRVKSVATILAFPFRFEAGNDIFACFMLSSYGYYFILQERLLTRMSPSICKFQWV